MSDRAAKLAKYKADALAQLEKAGESNIDDALLSKLVDNLKLVIDNKDALAVAGSDPSELETVRKNFVVKKLKISDPERGAEAVNAVAKKMADSRMKNRAAFYYLLQKSLT
ncbi:MAG: DUF2853 family protein [Gammaproteobacteria bacterium]|nr:DUF2853 family protein [Gammaproteobacteria bacterium]